MCTVVLYYYACYIILYSTDCDAIWVDVDTHELIVDAVKCVQVPMECAISRADCLETFVSTHQLSVVVMYPHYAWLNIGGKSATKAYNMLFRTFLHIPPI